MCFKINNYLILLIYCYIINKTFRLWGDNVIILILDKKEAENIIKKLDKGEDFEKLAVAFSKLNNSGQKKAVEQIDLLTKIPEYQKDSSDRLTVQAAHERTDIDVTDEMRQHDDDIMNDENF